MKLSDKSIDNPINVVLFVITIIVIGIISLRFLPIEMVPEIEIPVVTVVIVYNGASPAEIEYQINKEVEEELKGLTDVKKVTSIASQGVGTIVVEFQSGTNLDTKRFDVKEAVDNAVPDMPKEIETPIVRSVDFDQIPVMNILLYGKGTNYMELKDVAERVKEVFELVPQVSNADIFGGLDREITIAVDPYRLWANKVSLTQVVQFFQGGNINSPGGKIKMDNRDYPIRVMAKFVDARDVEKTIFVYRDGKPIFLRDLGKITGGTAEVTSYARYNGDQAISIALYKESKTNLLKLSDGVHKAIQKIQASGELPKGLKFAVIGDQADEVRIRVRELTSSIVLGIIAVFIVLYLSLGAKNALIVASAIPFCMIFTMIGLLVFDDSINNVMQFGLILVVGIVVDGAIVILENVYRHRELDKDRINAAKDGAEEVGTAVISSVLTTMAAFAPMLFMTGVVGQFMAVIPKTVLLALTGSLLFDHVVIPVLCSKYLQIKKPRPDSFMARIKKTFMERVGLLDFHPFERLFKHYQRLIRWSLNYRKTVALITFIIFLLGLMLLVSLDKEFFPEVDVGKLWVNIELPKGSSVEATNEICVQVEKILKPYLVQRDQSGETSDRKNRILKFYSATVGTSGVSTSGGATGGRGEGANTARISIDMVDLKDRDIGVDDFSAILRAKIRDKCAGARFKVTKPKGGPPTGDPVNVVFYGKKIRTLKDLAKKATALIKEIPGAINVEDNYGIGRPEIQIPIDRFKAERYGVSVQDIQNMIFVLNNGFKVSDYQLGQKTYEIRIKLDEAYKTSIRDLKKLTIYSSSLQRPIPLTEVVDIRLEAGLSFIQHLDYERSITVKGEVDVSHRTTAEVSNEVIKTLSDPANLTLSKGYRMSFKGENEDTKESFDGLKYSFLVGLMMIYFIVVIQLKSFIQPISIMITVLLSVVGISLGLFLSGNNVGIMALFGGVSLAGIVVNDAIVLVSYLNILRER
ncbi:MAG: acriflavin resistance protein [bacterium]|nr:MAG: acriflavin resistance protein [bacterium]